MNSNLNKLQAYPFARLSELFANTPAHADKSAINLSIGEPKHAAPEIVLSAIQENIQGINIYPKTKGLDALRETIANWLCQRFALNSVNANTQVIPVNGTREALFAFAQCIIDSSAKNPLVVSPNPFYQIYEGAAYLAGATPHFLACTRENNYIPNFSAVNEQVWQDCQLLYICTPGNPSGAVMSIEQLQALIKLAEKYNFVIASDECYSEIYRQSPPPGLLQACELLGNTDYKHCVVFHSLSKRSNLPGLRSGFVAGDAQILEKFLLYRTYHGCSMSEMVQHASIAAWQDEKHADINRDFYQEKFAEVVPILSEVCNFEQAPASFYIWLPTAIDDKQFASQLRAEENVTVLPGSFLSRAVDGINPGANHVRIALVAEKQDCVAAAKRIVHFIKRNKLSS